MIYIPVLQVGLNALDALLFAVAKRLTSLANNNDEAVLALLKDKNVTLQFTSDDGVARFYRFDNGQVSQNTGRADNADLTIHFTDSTQGAKLLAKGDTVAIMSAIQDGKMQVTGDYKLILWFAQLARLVAKIPEQYKPYVDTAKPYLQKISQFFNKK